MKKTLSKEENNIILEVKDMLNEDPTKQKPTSKSGDFILLYKMIADLQNRIEVLEKK